MNLQQISLETKIGDRVRKQNAWSAISDFSKFPSLCKNIDQIIISSETGIERISEWDVTFDGAPLTWIQKDILDKHNYTVSFRSISGDFEQYAGSLHVENTQDAEIAVVFSISYNVGIPIIEDLFGPVFREKMVQNFKAMLSAIAGEISRHKIANDERCEHRHKIGVHEAIILDGKTVHAKIEDISSRGMMFSCEESLENPVSVQACGLDLYPASLHHELFDKKYRLVFAKPIYEDRLLHIVKMLQSRHITTLGKFFTMEPKSAVYS
jgi:ribosome-associated toxin RatA of RatAB toxin-antitoxin module